MFKRIVLIVGMPRSGTSWLSQIVDSSPLVRFRLSPLFSYDFKNAVNEESSKEEFDQVFEGAYQSNNEFMDQTYRRRNNEYPIFKDKLSAPPVLEIKMTRFHNLLQTILDYYENLNVVSIVRHPCGAIHSWLTAPREFPEDADASVEWRSGACRKTGPEEFWGFEDWLHVTQMHVDLEEKYQDRFRIIRYEDLVYDAWVESKKLFHFLDLGFGKQTQQFVRRSQTDHNESSYAVFKNPAVKDRWRSQLNANIQHAILEKVSRTELRRFII